MSKVINTPLLQGIPVKVNGGTVVVSMLNLLRNCSNGKEIIKAIRHRRQK